jgi:hypothetical protein
MKDLPELILGVGLRIAGLVVVARRKPAFSWKGNRTLLLAGRVLLLLGVGILGATLAVAVRLRRSGTVVSGYSDALLLALGASLFISLAGGVCYLLAMRSGRKADDAGGGPGG